MTLRITPNLCRGLGKVRSEGCERYTHVYPKMNEVGRPPRRRVRATSRASFGL